MNRHALCQTLMGMLFLQLGFAVSAQTLLLPPRDVDLIGQVNTTRVLKGETLLDVARRYNLGQNEILLANPTLDRWLPEVGSRVLLPTRYVLPQADREGIVLNVAEMRLYHFPTPTSGAPPVVVTHPVSIGRMDWQTPLGRTKIIAKSKDPTWRPPKSLQKEAAAEGDSLPEVVPPGPENPLGRFALRLGLPGYLIHSTNKPFGVGMRVTHGCVRMYPEDIQVLFDDVAVHTPVQIVNQPIKLGWLAGILFIEVHPPLDEEWTTEEAFFRRALVLVYDALAQRQVVLDGRAFRKAVMDKNGIPVPISK